MIVVVVAEDILDKLYSCKFFDDEVRTSMFFPTLHDAMMYVQKKHPQDNLHKECQLKELYIQTEVSKNSLSCSYFLNKDANCNQFY